MSSSGVFGLHVGNTGMCIAITKDEKTEILANEMGDRVTPAVFSVGSNEKLTGITAKQGMVRNSGNTVLRVKQQLLLGEEAVLPHSRIASCPHGKHERKGWGYSLEDEGFYKLHDVLTEFYKKMHSVAGSQLKADDVIPVVLCIPHDVTDDCLQKMTSCASSAGFQVLRTVNESAAAALAYNIGQEDPQESLYCVVYRVGGCTCSVTVLQVTGGMYTIKSHVQKDDLGGDNMTSLVVDFLAQEFKTKWGEDPRMGKRSLLKLYRQGEIMKHVLSRMSQTSCFIEQLCSGVDFGAQLSRGRFESLISSSITSYVSIITDALTQAGITQDQVKKVVLCGGGTLVPKVVSSVSSCFSSAEVLTSINADEVIAYGASVQASLINPDIDMDEELQRDIVVLPSSIYIKMDEDSESTVSCVEEGCAVPCRKTITLPAAKPNSRSILLYQANTLLTKLNLPEVSEGEICELKATFILTIDGCIDVTVEDVMSSNSTSVIIPGQTSAEE